MVTVASAAMLNARPVVETTCTKMQTYQIYILSIEKNTRNTYEGDVSECGEIAFDDTKCVGYCVFDRQSRFLTKNNFATYRWCRLKESDV